MTKDKQLKLIDDRQNEYVDLLIKLIKDRKNNPNKELNFQSQTGTGKSIMIAKLINKLPNLFFIITTLSRGNLKSQLQDSFDMFLHKDNYVLFASQDLTKNTILQANDFIKEIRRTNTNKNPIIWIRDEGHIATNNFSKLFKDMIELQINVSATNKHINDIDCNFLDTCMLRTPILNTGTYVDAIKKLLEIKELHKDIKNYNPCMVARVLDEKLNKEIREYAKLCNLNVIDLNDDTFNMKEICSDDSKYDIIINKMKIVEGVDIRRCHVMYISNKIGTDTTNVQLIGRSRRNALLWRNDIDIFKDISKDLFRETEKSYIYYNYDENVLETDEFGNLQRVCCDLISIEKLKPNINIEVEDGRLPNGFRVMELIGKTGTFHISVDKETGFNIVNNKDFYSVKDLSVEDEAKYLGELFFRSYHSCDLDGHFIRNSKYEKPYLKVLGRSEIYNDVANFFTYIQSKDVYIVCKKNKNRSILSTFKKVNNAFIECSYNEDKIRKILLGVDSSDLYYHYTLKKNDNNLTSDPNPWNYRRILSQKDYHIISYIEKNNVFNTNYVVYKKWLNESAYIHLCDGTFYESKVINQKFEYLNECLKECELDIIIRLEEMYQMKIESIKAVEYSDEHITFSSKVVGIYKNTKWSIDQQNYKNWFIKYHFLPYSYIRKHCLDIDYMKLMPNYKALNEYIMSQDDKFVPYNDNKYYRFVLDLYRDSIYPETIDDFDKIQFIDRRDMEEVNKKYKLSIHIDELADLIDTKQLEVLSDFKLEFIKQSGNSYWDCFTDEEKEEHLCLRYICNDDRILARLNKIFDYSEIVKLKEDEELKILGYDLTKYSKQLNSFINDRHISTNIAQYTKLSRFISSRCEPLLRNFKPYSKRINYNFHKKCNLLLEICVIYYAKYLIYGKKILSYYLKGESKEDIINACVEKYKELQKEMYGNSLIRNINVSDLRKDEYQPFCEKVVELANATVSFLNSDLVSFDSNNILHPALVCDEFIGICDFINYDTIVDIKCNGIINEVMVKQILAYYYLSTKRRDLNIKKIIVFDASTGNYVLITTSNMKMHMNY